MAVGLFDIQMPLRPLRNRIRNRITEVLELVANGGSRSDIAKRLHVSESTIKTHLEHIYEKLGAHDRAAAVGAAMRQGLIV